MRKEIEEILRLFSRSKRVLVSSHQDPDGDSIGSQLALAALAETMKKKVLIANQGSVPGKYAFLDLRRRIITEKSKKTSAFKPDLVIVAECPYLERIGWVINLFGKEIPVINIDHHPDNTSYGAINYLDKDAAAVGEMVYAIWVKAGLPISPSVANWLYAAILTDTGRFRYSSTTSRSLRICAQLLKLGADARLLTDKIYFTYSEQNLRMLGRVLAGLQLFENGKISCLTIDKRLAKDFRINSADTEGLVDYSLFVDGAQIGLLIKEIRPNRVKVSLRSQDHLDIGRLARQFGGGGHQTAAGFALDRSLPEAKKLILAELKKWI
jgi:phosphoesterase RecJ-like protein